MGLPFRYLEHMKIIREGFGEAGHPLPGITTSYASNNPLLTREQFHGNTEGLQVEETDCLEVGPIFVG